MLEVENLTKVFHGRKGTTTALGDISLHVEDGEFLTIVGPSGCGKTTLLRGIAGLEEMTSGKVRLDGKVVTTTPANMAVVFQDYRSSLMPWLTVRKNILLPLRHQHLSGNERAVRIEEAAAAVGMTEFFDHYPWQLSGGMQQRVAIARALAYRPEILLMDEPFASVDAQTRAELEDLILKIRAKYGMTILLVTHDVDEAVYLGDRVATLSGRPSHVTGEIQIDLGRDRDQIVTKELPAFAHLRGQVLRAVRDSVLLAATGSVDTVH